ncbi:DUF262 domain-containing protein [Streptomyces virginiae]|uniref:DUF262 domain-containing protein n=1 Tax=Streptomyces virginiae TaxID=1961 RepID=UPI00386E1A20|nr:DUF262 domain-containing protein [Streptomyces virginiae]
MNLLTTSGFDTQPSATTYELEDLISLAWRGHIRVPHFQRDFRWGTQDVIRLFDSISKGYPIGNLLLWERRSGPGPVTLGTLEIEAPAADNALWVVDGQQRITSLANALHPAGNDHPPFAIYYDLAMREFVARPKVLEAAHIPLPVLFDLDRLLDWFSGVGQESSEYFPEARQVAKRLRQYKVPAYLVRQDDERVLTDIFDRMNNYGKRLSRAEIFSALFAGPEEDSADRLSIPRIAEQVAARSGFGTIDANTVLHAILARRGPDPTRDIRSEFDDSSRRTAPEFPGEDRDTAYGQGEQALALAISFLQEKAGVPHASFLTYKALLVVLTRFFAHFPNPRQRNLELLRRTYWRVSVSGPAVFKGSFTQMSRILCAVIKPGDEDASVSGLIDSMASARRVMPNVERFRTNEATGKIILCSWWALRPRSPITGSPYDAGELTNLLGEQSTAAVSVQYVFPRGLDSRRQLWAANRLFMPGQLETGDAFLERMAQQPMDLDDEVWDGILASYVLDRSMMDSLSRGERDAFLVARQKKAEDQLHKFLSQMAEWEYEDTPALDSLDFDELDGEESDGSL